MVGADPNELHYGGDGAEFLPSNMEEEIITAEDYLDDMEEEEAQPINKKREEQRNQEEEGNSDMNESSIE